MSRKIMKTGRPHGTNYLKKKVGIEKFALKHELDLVVLRLIHTLYLVCAYYGVISMMYADATLTR